MKPLPRFWEPATSMIRNSRPCRQPKMDHSVLMARNFSSGTSSSSTRRGTQCPTATRLQDFRDLDLNPRERRKHALFLHEELQIRFARSLQELTSLPHGLSQQRKVKKIISTYEDIFCTLEGLPAPSADLLDREFVDVLKQSLCEDAETVSNLILSVKDTMEDMGCDMYESVQPEVDTAVERFLKLHISMRFLANHYIEPTFSRSGRLGAFQLECHLGEVARTAAKQCASLCKSQFGYAPKIIVHDESCDRAMAAKAHVHYILTEIFKNAQRSVVEQWGSHCSESGEPLPAISCEITQKDAEATVKISDLGGGIAQSRMDDIWKYAFTTSRCSDKVDRKRASAMAGYGVGLPMSRLYARYFGGDLAICSVSGVGTDVYYRLSFRGTESENLPQEERRLNFPLASFALPPWVQKSAWQLSKLQHVRALGSFATRR